MKGGDKKPVHIRNRVLFPRYPSMLRRLVSFSGPVGIPLLFPMRLYPQCLYISGEGRRIGWSVLDQVAGVLSASQTQPDVFAHRGYPRRGAPLINSIEVSPRLCRGTPSV